MKKTLERELKFDVDPGFELPELGGRRQADRTFTSTYYDTAGRCGSSPAGSRSGGASSSASASGS